MVLAYLLISVPFTTFGDVVMPRESVTSYVNVRLAADAGAEVIAQLRAGETLELVASVESWHEVALADGRTGFISREWTEVLAASPAIASETDISPAPTVPPEAERGPEASVASSGADNAGVAQAPAGAESNATRDAAATTDEERASRSTAAATDGTREPEAAPATAADSATESEPAAQTEPQTDSATESELAAQAEPQTDGATESEPAAQAAEVTASANEPGSQRLMSERTVATEPSADTHAVAAETDPLTAERAHAADARQGHSMRRRVAEPLPAAAQDRGAQEANRAHGPGGSPELASIEGTVNYLTKFTGPMSGGDSQIFDDGINVGIGTAEPEEPLDVNGNLQIFNRNSNIAILALRPSTGETGYITHNLAGTLIIGAGSQDRITIDGNGNVGIGTGRAGHPLAMASGAHVTAGGVWTNASSRESKQDIEELDLDEALTALGELNPVQFSYKVDPDDSHVGFIAEDAPDLVASKDRRGLSSMDIVAVLTKVVQAQQQRIDELESRLEDASR